MGTPAFPLAGPIQMRMKTGHPGKVVAFDGIDGTGKGTLVALAQTALARVGFDVIVLRQPGGTKLGDELRKVMFSTVGTQNIHNDALECLFIAAHLQGQEEVVIPALKAGKIVLADRQWPSAIAYMKVRGASKCLQRLYTELCYVKHDLLYLLVGEPEKLLARANARPGDEGKKQASKTWNSAEVQADVQRQYLDGFGGAPNTQIIDTTWMLPAEIMTRFVVPRLEALLECSLTGEAPLVPKPKRVK